MSFQPKITAVLSADGTSILVTDVTGNYNAGTNPGGWGAPNPVITSIIILRWKLYNSSTWIAIPVTQAQLAAGFTINSTILGVPASYVQPVNPQVNAPQPLPDGVEFVELLVIYNPLSPGAPTVGVTPGSNIVNVSSSVYSFAGINYLVFISDTTTVYQILSQTPTYIVLDKPYAGSLLADTPFYAANADALLLNAVNVNSYIDNIMASVTSEELEGKLLDKVFYKTMKAGIAQSRFNQQDYYGADLILQNLYSEILIESTIGGY